MKTPLRKVKQRLHDDGLRVTHVTNCDGCRQYRYIRYRFLENIGGVYIVKAR